MSALLMCLRKKQGILCIERLLRKTTVKITSRKRNSHLSDTAI